MKGRALTSDVLRLPDLPGWTAPEAASLAGLPARTVQHWRKTEFVIPTVHYSWPGGAVSYYGLADVVTLRVVRDLLSAGAPREVVRRVAVELALLPETTPGAPPNVNYRRLAEVDVWVVVPVDERLVEMLGEEGRDRLTSWFLVEEERTLDDLADVGAVPWGSAPADGDELFGWCFPLSEVARDVVETVDAWMHMRGVRQSEAPAVL